MGDEIIAETNEASGDGVSEIAADLIENQSEVQPHAVEAEKSKISGEKSDAGKSDNNATGALKDSAGTFFDPSIHMTDSSGKPSLTKLGRFRKKTVKNRDPSIVQRPGSDAQGKQDSGQNAGSREAAFAVVSTIEQVGMILAGDEWRMLADPAIGLDEKRQGIDAWTYYFDAKGVTDFPPGVALAIWAISYALPRFTMPKTKSRMERVGNWLKIKILSRRNKKQPEDKGGEK